MQRTDSLEKTLMLGKMEGRRRRDDGGWDGWMALPTQRTWVWASSGSWWWTGKPGVLQSMGSQRVRHDWATELNWLTRFAPWMGNRPFQLTEFPSHPNWPTRLQFSDNPDVPSQNLQEFWENKSIWGQNTAHWEQRLYLVHCHNPSIQHQVWHIKHTWWICYWMCEGINGILNF